ncbi:PIN domain-containing protein [Hydrogenophaga atypica]|uniref:PIN domain-containing protein n=1 Tax=Hydrogenophaga atypica TaxID=249409 RepID=A0ABW2QQY5_9BURK
MTQSTHVLVDWENVQPTDAEILALVPDATDVWIFHGKQQKKVDANQKAFSDHLTLVPVSRAGKNALDFHLSFYMGYITSRNPDARFVVIANDQGYGPMLDHAKELGFDARQVGFGPTPKKAPAKRASAKTPKAGSTPSVVSTKPVAKAATKKTPSKKTAPAKSAASTPALKPSAKAKAKAAVANPQRPTEKVTSVKTSTAKKDKKIKISEEPSASDKDYDHVLKSLRKTKNKPSREARLKGAVKSLLPADRADDARVAAVIQRLIAEGIVTVDAQGAVTVKQAQ